MVFEPITALSEWSSFVQRRKDLTLADNFAQICGDVQVILIANTDIDQKWNSGGSNTMKLRIQFSHYLKKKK